MSKVNVPADERVHVVTQRLLDKGTLTIRNDDDGADARVYESEDDEGDGFPLRADDEWCISSDPSQDGLGQDGLWIETESNSATTIEVLKGACIERNVRRDFNATIDDDDVGLLQTSDQPLDVSGATVDVQESTPLDVSGATVDVQEDTALDVSGATVDVEQQTPIGVEDSQGNQVDPAENVDGASTSSTTTSTGSANAATVSAPDGRTALTAAWDVSGSATITVEISPDGGANWFEETTKSPGSAETGTYNFSTGFDDVRVHVDQNLNRASIGAKGA